MDKVHLEASQIPLYRGAKKRKKTGDHITLLGTSPVIEPVREVLSELTLESIAEAYVQDLGNLHPSSIKYFEDIPQQLMSEGSGVPVIICHRTHENLCYNSFIKKHHSVGIIDKSGNDYMAVDRLNMHQARMIGIQKHCNTYSLDRTPARSIRLGLVKSNPQAAEVALRNIEIAILHIDAIRYGDNIGNEGSMTSGLTIEEMCQMAKFAGASTNLKAVIIAGYDPEKDVLNMMAKNVALMIYYLLDGYGIRQAEKANLENANTYTVIPDNMESELIFFENKQSGRWWVQVPFEEGSEPVLIACTQRDYEDACQNHISDRIMRVFAKI